ncbi:MAG: alpha/beta fold hydrolase [Gemmatimonadetes bacterium]|nr:alpha/beta fold hydrolase [Gemmatimonadota bacterium]
MALNVKSLRRSTHLASLGVLLAGGVPAAAQDIRDAGILRMFTAGKEIGRERFVRAPDYLETETAIPVLAVKIRTRASYDPRGRLTRYEARVFRLPQDSLLQTYQARMERDSVRVALHAGGRDTSWVVAAQVDAVAASQSLAVFGDLVHRAAARDTVFRLWSAERNAALRVSVRHQSDTIQLDLDGLTITATIGPDGRTRTFDIPAQRVHVERAPTPDLPDLPGLERPAADYSVPADAPYTAEEVRIPVRPVSGEPFELAGTVTLPKRRGPHPAVVMITGSGAQDRDENLWPLVPTYRPFREIADRLTREGIAVLRVNDRGFAPSGGSRDSATMDDFADDVRAQIAWLRARGEINPERIALAGHSEGGVVGPMVAASDPRVAAVAIMAGTAKSGLEVLRDQLTWPIESASGLSPERKRTLREQALRSLEQDTARLDPWMRHFRAYDPKTTARRMKQPVLILQGALDRQVTAGQADTLAQVIRAGGNRDVTVRVFPRLNHLFLVALSDGAPAEYAAIEDTRVASEVLDALAAWLVERLR